MKAELFAFVVLYLRQPQHDRSVIKIGAVAFFYVLLRYSYTVLCTFDVFLIRC